MLIAAGADVVHVSKQLGHADPAITLRVYADEFAARDNADVHVVERLDLLELDATVVVSVGYLWVDTHSLVAARAEHRNEATERAAANVDYLRWRSG